MLRQAGMQLAPSIQHRHEQHTSCKATTKSMRASHACVVCADPTTPCRLPGSDLLLGLPVVLDTNNDNIREGQRVRPHTLCRLHGSPVAALFGTPADATLQPARGSAACNALCSLQGRISCFQLHQAAL